MNSNIGISPIASVLNRLRDVKKTESGWTALCPAHADAKPSLSIKEGTDGKVLLRCFAGCELDAICNALECEKRDLFPKRNNKSARAKGFDWQRCVAALKPKDLVRLSNERWLSHAFCSWLHEGHLVGFHGDNFAFPVGHNGAVAAAHCRVEDGSWRYYPAGIKIEPFVIGDLSVAKQIHVFESQWDAFALADRTGLYKNKEVAFIATRGASNAALVKGLIPQRLPSVPGHKMMRLARSG